MKVYIEIEMDSIEVVMGSAAFEHRARTSELHRILSMVASKVGDQLRRPDSLCDAPEAADKLLDINGNTVGSVRLEK
jgi:hypothetical protein